MLTSTTKHLKTIPSYLSILLISLLLLAVPLFLLSGTAMAQSENETSDLSEDEIENVESVQKYYRAIHVMVMLLAGFGFLMTFIRGYGRSALTATFLLVSVAIPLYILIKESGIFGEVDLEIDRLILAEFAAASLLICAGAVLGRLKMPQYMLLGLLFIPFYMLNEWILLDGGLGIVSKGDLADTGGSIVIHAFGALFGLGVILTMTTEKEFKKEIETDATSDRFSLLGSMLLWIFWPSFCAALVPMEDVPGVAINVILALCGSTLATYFATTMLRGSIGIADIANAALAGGVAIGATCDYATNSQAILIGIFAGVLSTVGFAVVQAKLQDRVKAIDTCGVTNLHGMPGIMGGLAALFIVSGINVGAQLSGIVVTIVIALVTGFASGFALSFLGRRIEAYEDSEEILEAQEEKA